MTVHERRSRADTWLTRTTKAKKARRSASNSPTTERNNKQEPHKCTSGQQREEGRARREGARTNTQRSHSLSYKKDSPSYISAGTHTNHESNAPRLPKSTKQTNTNRLAEAILRKRARAPSASRGLREGGLQDPSMDVTKKIRRASSGQRQRARGTRPIPHMQEDERASETNRGRRDGTSRVFKTWRGPRGCSSVCGGLGALLLH